MFPLVSIVIPAKGDLRFFSQTLKSIDDSIFRDFEVVVIDDGIFPNKRVWVADYFKAKQGYKLIMNQGIGIVSALNTGISNSSGIYIARLDADDCMSSDRLKIQVDFLKSNPHIGVVGSQVTYINEIGDKIAESRYLNGYVFDSPNSFKNCSIAHPSVMIRRDVLEKVGGYTSLLIYRGVDFAEDFFLWLRISKISLLFNLQDPLTYYRQHENQVSRSKMSITSLASLLVFIKSIDCQNRIPTPIHLEQIRSREKKLLYGPCLKKFDFPLMFLLHLKLLAAKDFNKQLSNGTNLLARLLSRIMGFSRPQN